ncbi:MAG: hypothetical protein NZ898_03960 [Myxococcota bacterium]|nr:hypothetical protein [Myxococcota bacterium]MDW8362924.1 hypothetical protein [Myxococcales bacterium]
MTRDARPVGFLHALFFVGAMGSVATWTPARAQVSFTGSALRFDFSGYAGRGFRSPPMGGELDSDHWSANSNGNECAYGATCSGTPWGLGASGGGVTTGGIYAFNVPGTAPALGWQPSSSAMNPGVIRLRIRNDSGLFAHRLTLSFVAYYRNDQGRSTRLGVRARLPGGVVDSVVPEVISPVDPVTPPSWEAAPRGASVDLRAVGGLRSGEVLELLFETADAPGGAGSRDEMAVDDIDVSLALCGDGRLDRGEECDDGAANGTTPCGCRSDCTLVPAGATCRPQSGDCDPPEVCDGSSADCPPDLRATAGTECRPARGLCDVAERCDGSSVDCPPDRVAARGVVCGEATDLCDEAERCDGTSPHCPPDRLAPAGQICRASEGLCDVEERCDGRSAACPANAFAGPERICRASRGDCDLAERCSGSSPDCPSDGRAGPDVVCRPARGTCDPAERCSGASDECPTDVRAPDGTACDDGSVCNGADACRAGSCVAVGPSLACDDGNPCTADSCAEPMGCRNAPIPGCCLDDAACDDRNPCTLDRCEASTRRCAHERDPACDDAGSPEPDAGSPEPDGGSAADGGEPLLDAGGEVDGGPPPPDGSTLPEASTSADAAGVDSAAVDASGRPDATVIRRSDADAGCACATHRARGWSNSALPPLVVVAFVLRRHMRRSRRRARP